MLDHSGGIILFGISPEVTSSGTLHFGLTPTKLSEPHESLPWNPLIARTIYRRGIIEEWGRAGRCLSNRRPANSGQFPKTNCYIRPIERIERVRVQTSYHHGD